jgi:uncharacterized membrane protein YebE (DUF533 family)
MRGTAYAAWDDGVIDRHADANAPRDAILRAMHVRLATCLLLTEVLAADGMIRDAERRLLDETMDRVGLDPAERRRVADLDGLDEAARVVAGLEPEEKTLILDELTSAALADGQLSAQEIKTIAKITAAIGM